jgi:hypothetical protein
VNRRGVLKNLECREIAGGTEPGRLKPVNTDLFTRLHGFGKGKSLETGVKPGTGHQTGRRGGTDLLGKLSEAPMVMSGEEPLFDAQLAQRNLEDLEVGDLIDHGLDGAVVVVVVVVVVVGHILPFIQLATSARESLSGGCQWQVH